MSLSLLKKQPCVFLVGAGPGDEGLVTLRAKQVLEKAEIVFYDYLVNPQILKYSSATEKHYVGKNADRDSFDQQRILQELLKAAKKYSYIVRLKGGDPFLFGRGGEEAEFLVKNNIKFEIVPGVSSALAVPAFAGIPLTHRQLSSTVTILTGHEDPEKNKKQSEAHHVPWSQLASQGTLVFLMGVKNIFHNFQKLIHHGMNSTTPAAMIEWGSYPFQRTIEGDLETLPKKMRMAKVEAPAIIVVGKTSLLRHQLKWLEKKPLFGKVIYITRARHQASQLVQILQELGAHTVEMPTIKISPPETYQEFDQVIVELKKIDWILFTSVNSVEYFFCRLRKLKKDIRELHGIKIAAVGPVTSKALEKKGLMVARQPKEFTAKALSESFSQQEIFQKNLLLPRGNLASSEILTMLKQKGAEPHHVTVYQTKKVDYSSQELNDLLSRFYPNALSFSSSSSVRHFFEIIQKTSWLEPLKQVPAFSIGPVTKGVAQRLGFSVTGLPKQYTIEYLAQCILGYFSGDPLTSIQESD